MGRKRCGKEILSAAARREYAVQVGPRYRRAGRAERSKILDEFCAACGYERKYAIKLLKGRRRAKRSPGQRGAKPIYGAEQVEVVKAIWLSSEQPCSKRLVAVLPVWMPFYERHHGKLGKAVREGVLSMSASTIDRLLSPLRARMGPRRVWPTKPGKLLRTEIPIRTRWEEAREETGWIEADTVAHCGGSMAGDFIWSLTLTDIYSGWSEMGAVWNRGGEAMMARVGVIEKRLVFPIAGFDCDNGSEFLNHHLMRHFTERAPKVKLTRSRPYMSNDNAHVEQKQWTHVRQLLGYDRLDDPQLVEPINALYAFWGLLNNFFLPSAKLVSSEREGAKIRRRHDRPQTPCDRLLGCPTLSPKAKAELRRRRAELDPFELRQRIEAALKPITRWMQERRAELRRANGSELAKGSLTHGVQLERGRAGKIESCRVEKEKRSPEMDSASPVGPPPRRSGRSSALPYPPDGSK